MLNLLISATDKIVVELFDGTKCVSAKTVTESNLSEDILLFVKEKLGGKNINDVSNILLNVGPGSFTGIRASMALVFGLVLAGKQKIVPFTTFDMYSYNTSTGNYMRVVAGFSSFVYVCYNMDGKVVMDCMTVSDAVTIANNLGLKVKVPNNEIQRKFESFGVVGFQEELDPLNVITKFESGKLEKRKVEPVYLRASQAEIQRQEKLNNAKPN